jgi:pyrimidine-specific ribonucleoside hydrolase
VSRWFASPEELSARQHPDTVPALTAHIFHFLVRNFGRPDVSIGDAGCVASVIDQGGLTIARLPVAVELHGTHTRGMTVVDRRRRDSVERHAPDDAANADVALDVDIDFYRRLFREAVADTERNNRS